jgi:hypothetical protein
MHKKPISINIVNQYRDHEQFYLITPTNNYTVRCYFQLMQTFNLNTILAARYIAWATCGFSHDALLLFLHN